ncbi:apolipoprotein N-acyltransferase [Armatimonas sp.]|uniref:apolipoprotein N-acyltransferase n=1 Tax=Armatimonas sp. TaxID=1872638 RepID=UPI00286D1841|nr:apolipoprotein N-acyltransferase [Armatimonas sp.]
MKRRNWSGLSAPLSGLLLVLAFPNFNLWPLAWVALVPFYLALVCPAGWSGGAGERRTSATKAVPAMQKFMGGTPFVALALKLSRSNRGSHGFWLGFTIFLTGVYWISELNGSTPADKLFPWIGLAAIQGSFFACFAALAGWAIPKLPAPARPFAFAAGWVTFELIRSLGVLNFPWMILAVSQAHGGGTNWLQLVSVGGQWLLSFAIALVNGLLAEAWKTKQWKPALLAGALFLGIGISGFNLTLQGYFRDKSTTQPRITVAALQGGREASDGVPDYAPLTEQAKADLVIWPEAAAGPLVGAEWRSRYLSELAIRTKTDLLIGAGEAKPHTNTVWHIRPDGSTGGRYDKQVLVPGGEFFPLYEVLGPIYFRFGATPEWNHVPGSKPAVFTLAGGTKVGTIICYESVLPWVARQEVQQGAEFLVQPTSDSSFGKTAGPYQHLGIVITRAVENRRYIVRAAATGVSAIISPTGQIVNSLDLNKTGALTGGVLPLTERSLASQIGDLVAYLCAAGSVLALAYPLTPAGRGKHNPR